MLVQTVEDFDAAGAESSLKPEVMQLSGPICYSPPEPGTLCTVNGVAKS